MHPFQYQRASSLQEAQSKASGKRRYLAGGTTIVDLMKLNVEQPDVLTDISHLPWNKIEQKGNSWQVGAMVTNSDLAQHAEIKKHFSVLSEAILAGASPQLRNRATTGGNLLQRTRCVYFRDPSKACNKRQPGSGCSAIEGHNRNLAVLGTSAQCIATNPSDMNVALAALEARVQLQQGKASREVPMADFHLVPGEKPEVETVLQPDELISGVIIPSLPAGAQSFYLKLRDRASYEFALASVAVVVSGKEGRIERIRYAMGGIGTKPWRVPEAEKMLEGKNLSDGDIRGAVARFLDGAKAYSENGFKIELARRCLQSGLEMARKRVST
jgi:xanthine dehydrogenase YagS FAD-binding subunit